MQIKIVSNVMHNDLYEISKLFYKDMPYENIGISGENKFYDFKFFNHMIIDEKFKDIDVMIYIDEDCFITDTSKLQDLLDHSIKYNFVYVGMPDGGVVRNRTHNPICINPFFCILNLKSIRTEYIKHPPLNIAHTKELEVYTPYNLIKFRYEYDDFEPSYKLSYWMLRHNYKMLYLNADTYADDRITTILKSYNNKEFAYHTWYARKWDTKEHKERIENIIELCKKIKGI